MTQDWLTPLPDDWQEQRFPTAPYVERLGSFLVPRGWRDLRPEGTADDTGWEFRPAGDEDGDPGGSHRAVPRIASRGSGAFEVTLGDRGQTYPSRTFELETIIFLIEHIEQSAGEPFSAHVDGPYDAALNALLVDRGWTSMRSIKDELYFDEWLWRPENHPYPAEPTSIYCHGLQRVQVNLRLVLGKSPLQSFQLSNTQLIATLDRIEAHG